MAEAITREMPTSELAKLLVANDTNVHLPLRVIKKAFAFNSTSNGSGIQWQNPEDQAGLAAIVVEVTTAGTGTAGVDIGVGTANGSADNLGDALRVDTIAVVSPFGTGGGTNGKPWRKMSAKGGTLDYITGKGIDIDATAAANVYILFIPLA
mgnify:CR=1 FL=1